MSSLRERLHALRPGRASAAPAPEGARAAAAPAAAVRATSKPECHVSRRALPEWDLPPGDREATMAWLALLSREPALAALRPEDILFLDLETTGLSLGAGTVAFLVGLAWLERGGQGMHLVVEQHLLRAMSHEPAALRSAQERLHACGAVATFNGKSYDVPLLAGRCVLARLPELPRRPHLDALHPARRLLGHDLPDARLVTLEDALWGLRREDDIGGAAIPAAFFAALRGDDAMLEDVLRHNADDLVTLARLPPLLAALAAGQAAPTGMRADPLALGALRLALGQRPAALQAARGCVAPPGSARSLRQARLLKRAGGSAAAREHWQRLLHAPQGGSEAAEELAKILEHQDRDLQGALRIVEEALERRDLPPSAVARLAHRRVRLARRIAGLRGEDPAALPHGPRRI